MNIAVITGNIDLTDPLTAFFSAGGCTFHKDETSVSANADAIIDLSFTNTPEHIKALRSFLPKTILVNSVLHTLEELDASFIRFNGWPGFLNTNAVEVSFRESNIKQAEEIFTALNWNYVVCPDIPGFTIARVVSMIINEAFFAFGEGVSTKEEIDIAMKLGTNYPHGPFEWCSIIGIKNVYTLLKTLSATDERYAPATDLEKEAINNPNA